MLDQGDAEAALPRLQRQAYAKGAGADDAEIGFDCVCHYRQRPKENGALYAVISPRKQRHWRYKEVVPIALT